MSEIIVSTDANDAAIIDVTALYGPKGDKGDKGDTGEQGPQGDQGIQGEKGDKGDAATISVGTVTTGEPNTDASVTNSGTSSAAVFDFVIPKGAKGDTGATGQTGPAGADGANGQDGEDGFSPIAKVTQTASGATISITDANGTTTADISNGTNGSDGINGQDGADGYSPTATVSKSGDTTTITITDKNGTTTAQVLDGGANADLSNLSSSGESRLHALKSYEDAGELLTDAEGLADVKNYAKSSFRLSKFTVVGSPTITSDGVASGFSTSNYLTINTSNIDWTRPYKIKIKCNTGSIRTNGKANANLTCKDMPIIRLSNYKFHFSPSTTFASIGSVGEIIDNTTIDDSTTYYLIVNYDGTTYTFSKSIDDISYTTIGTSTTIQTNLTTGGTSTIGCGYGIDNNTNRVWDGPIDLKQFSITADGVLVFSGNKTGIDTIKADNYTVVGTPAITSDGIASGFSSANSNGIQTPTINWGNNVIFQVKLNSGDLLNNGDVIERISASDYCISLAVLSTGKLRYGLSSSGTAFDICANITGENVTISANTDYVIKIVFDGNSYKMYVNDVLDKTITSSAQLFNTALFIGGVKNAGATTYKFHGSIDLNAFKIYVDGDLVYQPCLKIPYTMSKTGSKIVDSIYRDRVSDMYSEFGYAPYYTLSDTDFTLPMGELYGLMRTLTDGQWIPTAYTTIANNVSWTTDTPAATYSLDDYLPKNDYNYEVLFTGTALTGANAQDFVSLRLQTDIIKENVSMVEARTPTTATVEAQGNVILPVGAGRYIKQYSSSSTHANGSYYLFALAYRRIGRNK